MAEKYYFDRGNLAWTLQTQNKVSEELKKSYEMMLEIVKSIEQSTGWSGKSKDTFISYMDLILQYHEALIHRKIGLGRKLELSVDSIDEAGNAIRECIVNMMDFPDSSESVRKMRGV